VSEITELAHAPNFGYTVFRAFIFKIMKLVDNKLEVYLEKRYPEFLKQLKYYERIVIENREYNNSIMQFEDIEKTKTDSFENVVRPVLRYLCENHHPHVTVIITPTTAELVEGIKTIGQVLDYVQD
jgi:hypothetical protein